MRSDLPGGREDAGDSVRDEEELCGEEVGFPLVAGRIVGRAEDETARLAAAADAGSSEPWVARDGAPTLEDRDFATGSEGSGPVGGATEGREGRGREWFFMVGE